ncbi:uncharacterized protein LOC127732557 [Mytilus californianus]|uniref:uncharacterized protein LOC127732557 n=1 Tax=Mytilus californianus TaxID=6549 RepID=UPI002245FC56|nr:uncharacterized protein LOC127732557 [Mytilus californianus]
MISLPSSDITEGSNVSIICKPDANPKVFDLQLFKDEKAVLHTDSDYNSLDMKNFTRSLAGNYRCTCRNIIGTDDDEIQLNVLYAPDVKIITNTSSGRVYLRCIAEGYPKKYRYLEWEHKTLIGEHIRYLKGDSTGSLYLSGNNSDTKYQDNGIYVCKVENGIVNKRGNLVQMATIKFNSDVPPVFVSDSKNVQYGSSGKSTRIVTYIYGRPKYHVLCCSSQNWTMCQDSHLYAFEERVTLVRDTFHGVVVLLQGYQVSFVTAMLRPEDFTLYSFEAINELGSEKLIVQLKHVGEDPNTECLNSLSSYTGESKATIYITVFIMMIFIILILSVYHIILVKRVKSQTIKNKDNVVNVESQYEEIQMEEVGQTDSTNDVPHRSIECLAAELNDRSCSSDNYNDNSLDRHSATVDSVDERGETQYSSYEKFQDEQCFSDYAYTEGRLSDTFVKHIMEG